MAAGGSSEHFSRGTSPWLSLRPRPQPAPVRLFCFPYSGAGASAFAAWAGEFPPDIEVCPVQLPGRESRLSEPPCRSLRELIPALARGLTPFLDRSFAFFGHSMGALVAFELARFLRHDPGLTPAWLFASAHRAPHLTAGGQVHRSSDAALARKLREINGTPAEVLENPELRELLFPIFRADFELCETYVHEPAAPLSCSIAALGGLADPHVDAEGLEAWRRHTSASLEVHRFPGDHFYLGPSRRALVRAIARRLQR